MKLTLEALQANDGDCLLLHYERAGAAPVRILVDGGSRGVYSDVLRARIDELRGNGSLNLRMVMVSHIDDDHITGVLDLTKMLRELHDSGEPLPYDILTLWHNSFDDIASKISASVGAELFASAKPKTADGAAIVASVAQGRQLRFDADAPGLNMNTGFDDMLLFNLDLKGISASGGSACSSGASTGSHVLGALYPNSKRGAVRFSFSKYNKPEDIDYAVASLAEICRVPV